MARPEARVRGGCEGKSCKEERNPKRKGVSMVLTWALIASAGPAAEQAGIPRSHPLPVMLSSCLFGKRVPLITPMFLSETGDKALSMDTEIEREAWKEVWREEIS